MSAPVLPPDGGDGRLVALTVNRMMRGGLDNVGTVTLDPAQPDTRLDDSRIGGGSVLSFMPQTAEAAAALGGLHVPERQAGFAILRHSTPGPNRTFRYAVMG